MVAPWSIGAFQAQLFKILQSRAATAITERTFTSAFGHFVIYVEEMSAAQFGLRGVIVSDERDPDRSRVIVAREGQVLSDEANRRITLRFIDGAISETEPGDAQRARLTAFSLYDMTVPIESPLSTGGKDEKPEREMPLGKLLDTAHALAAQGQIATPYFVEFKKRFACPSPRWCSCWWASRSVSRRRGGLGGRRISTFLIDRYLIREYAGFLGFGVLVGSVLFVVVDLLQTLDRFLRVKPPLSLILLHFAYNLPPKSTRGCR